MLSILIPIYNYDIVKLAQSLNSQCQEASLAYEVVCYDDFSKEKYRKLNRQLDFEFGISYIELSENHGRSKIRNMLARNARYENLLFVDCDSKIDNPAFIKNYSTFLDTRHAIYGGRKYSKAPPKTVKKYLHWLYGGKREALPLKDRSKKPFRSFQTNNFLISRELMLKFPFDEKIKTYGYEDLLMAETLKNEGITISHIDNPLIHKGVEYTEVFLHKAELAAENLAMLYHSGSLQDTKMLATHRKLKKIGFNSFLHNYIRRKKDRILKNLHSENPSLFYFDLFRYSAFHTKLNSLSASSS